MNGTPEEWAAILKSTVENYKLQFRDVRKDKKRKVLEEKIAKLRETIGYYDSLEKEYKTYKARLERQTASLEPIDFIEKHMSDLLGYCETGILLNKLKNAWTTLKRSYTPTVNLPENFENRRRVLRTELEQAVVELEKLNPMQPQNQSMQWIRSVILLAEKTVSPCESKIFKAIRVTFASFAVARVLESSRASGVTVTSKPEKVTDTSVRTSDGGFGEIDSPSWEQDKIVITQKISKLTFNVFIYI